MDTFEVTYIRVGNVTNVGGAIAVGDSIND